MGGRDRLPRCFGAGLSGVLGSEEERKGICHGIALLYTVKTCCSRINKKLIGFLLMAKQDFTARQNAGEKRGGVRRVSMSCRGSRMGST